MVGDSRPLAGGAWHQRCDSGPSLLRGFARIARDKIMPTDHEVQRLVDVFRRYRESDVIQAQWSETNPGNSVIARERTRAMGQVLNRAGYLPLTNCRVLEVGCGTGKVLAGL